MLYEKMFDFFSHQGNETRNTCEIPSHPSQMAMIIKTNKNKYYENGAGWGSREELLYPLSGNVN
jgi:hypothetical protein